MAYKLIRVENNTLQDGKEVTAILDSAGDLDSLIANEGELAPGSIAIVADAGLASFVLNASGEWKSTEAS